MFQRSIYDSRFTIHGFLRPFKRAFAPRVVITNHQDPYEDEHLDKRELREREIIAHENDCPGKQKNRLDIEDQKQHRHDVIAHREAIVGSGLRIDTALVRSHLIFPVFPGPQKSAED